MGSGASVYRYEGMYGFDWAIAKGDSAGVAFDMAIKVFANEGDDILRDRFDAVEALSGYTFDDVLEGDDRGRTHIGDEAGPTNDATSVNDILTQEGIDRIHGFSEWMAGARETLFGGDTPLVGGSEVATSYRDGNILIGGDGSDTLRGRGGFDLHRRRRLSQRADRHQHRRASITRPNRSTPTRPSPANMPGGSMRWSATIPTARSTSPRALCSAAVR